MIIEVYGREGCPKCVTTKNLLKRESIPFVERTIGVDVSREYVVEKFPNVRQLPIVTLNGTHLSESEVQDLVRTDK